MDDQIVPGGGAFARSAPSDLVGAPLGAATSPKAARPPSGIPRAKASVAPPAKAPLRKTKSMFGLAGIPASDQAVPAAVPAGVAPLAPGMPPPVAGAMPGAPLPPHLAMFMPMHLQHLAHGLSMPSLGSLGMPPQQVPGLPPGFVMPMGISMPGMAQFPSNPSAVGAAAAAAAAASAAAAAVLAKHAPQGVPGVQQADVAAAMASVTQAKAVVPAPVEAAAPPPAKRAKQESPPCAQLPAQKPRWETPLRAGNWRESWESAKELAGEAPTKHVDFPVLARTIRSTLSEVIIAHAGEQLPKATVEKWLCLLSEYLELNADEQILVVCLLRRYVDCGGLFVGEGDHMRPQTWERVVAVACFLAVLLSEEFPGRAASDLRELLGSNFCFGKEQMAFLKKVNWRVSISHEVYMETKAAIVSKNHDLLMLWFRTEESIANRRLRAEAAVAEAKSSLASLSAKAAVTQKKKALPSVPHSAPLSKKRPASKVFDKDGVVPGADKATGIETVLSGPWASQQWTY